MPKLVEINHKMPYADRVRTSEDPWGTIFEFWDSTHLHGQYQIGGVSVDTIGAIKKDGAWYWVLQDEKIESGVNMDEEKQLKLLEKQLRTPRGRVVFMPTPEGLKEQRRLEDLSDIDVVWALDTIKDKLKSEFSGSMLKIPFSKAITVAECVTVKNLMEKAGWFVAVLEAKALHDIVWVHSSPIEAINGQMMISRLK